MGGRGLRTSRQAARQRVLSLNATLSRSVDTASTEVLLDAVAGDDPIGVGDLHRGEHYMGRPVRCGHVDGTVQGRAARAIGGGRSRNMDW